MVRVPCNLRLSAVKPIYTSVTASVHDSVLNATAVGIIARLAGFASGESKGASDTNGLMRTTPGRSDQLIAR
jgi:hypothetical protein